MMNKKNDIEIINAIRSGKDGAVLNHLYKVALPNIIRFITRNNGDKDEAKDIFQDCVIALYNTIKLEKYDESKDVEGFLYHVARNLWINRIKKKNKLTTFQDIDNHTDEDTPLAYMVNEEKQIAIQGLMEKIGTPCKELLKFVMYDKLTMKEVAIKMGYAGETVAKSTHYHCKQKLAAFIYANKNLLSLLKE
ncbi:MAG: sigma-70 family RNA polymerase sigma factor [Opitutaceae bacterium]|nr:sigma-70 family RNA polymerase sigma factor [Cytophagales bacterium]